MLTNIINSLTGYQISMSYLSIYKIPIYTLTNKDDEKYYIRQSHYENLLIISTDNISTCYQINSIEQTVEDFNNIFNIIETNYYKYGFVYELSDDITSDIINSSDIIFKNIDWIILEREKKLYKLPFSNVYINTAFYITIPNDYRIIRNLKPQYQVSVLYSFNDSLLIKINVNDNEFKKIVLRIKNGEDLCSIFNIRKW